MAKKVLVTDTYLSDIADAIREKSGTEDTYTPAEMAEAIEDIETGITPTGTKQISITQNGTTTEDVTNYANAQISVNVPSTAPTGTKQISITENGTTTEDVSSYANAEITVNVPSSGGDPDSLIKRTWPTGAITTTATSITTYQFAQCTGITSISAPDVTTIGNNTFQGCSNLTSAYIPKLVTIPDSGFNQTGLIYAVFPLCNRVNYYGLSGRTLRAIDLGGTPTSSLGFKSTFNMANNTNLDVLVLRGSYVWPLANINAFQGTKFESGKSGGTLYVPQSLISSYQSATNWSTILGYANNSIQAIEGSIYATKYVDGTTIPS